DHTAGSAPVLEAAAPLIADEQHTIGGFQQPAGDRPLVHAVSHIRESTNCTVTIWRVTATNVPEHPNLPRRGMLGLMFAGIAVSGILGGVIGYALVEVSCSD